MAARHVIEATPLRCRGRRCYAAATAAAAAATAAAAARLMLLPASRLSVGGGHAGGHGGAAGAQPRRKAQRVGSLAGRGSVQRTLPVQPAVKLRRPGTPQQMCMEAAPGIVTGSAHSSLALVSACDDRYSAVRAVVEGRLYGRRCGVMGSDSWRWRPRACAYAQESPELCTEAAGSIASGSVRRVAARRRRLPCAARHHFEWLGSRGALGTYRGCLRLRRRCDIF